MDEHYTVGVCRFCGQVMTIKEELTEEAAGKAAEAQCGCKMAQDERERVAFAERERIHRKDTLMRAEENADMILGELSRQIDAEPMENEVVNLIKQLFGMVYDGKISVVNVKVESGSKIKVYMDGKGKLIVERSDVAVNSLGA